MAAISKDVKALAQQPWFPELMRELGYEPKRKTGRWNKDGNITVFWDIPVKCSQCGYRTLQDAEHRHDYNYCPNCGARMDGEADG